MRYGNQKVLLYMRFADGGWVDQHHAGHMMLSWGEYFARHDPDLMFSSNGKYLSLQYCLKVLFKHIFPRLNVILNSQVTLGARG